MRVPTALLADYANATKDGKLNVMGIFHQLTVSHLPASHPSMQLVLMLEGNRADAGREQKIEIRLMAPSGKDLFKMEGSFIVKGKGSGMTLRSHQILQMAGLTFTEEGGHIFYIHLNNHEQAAVPLDVILVTPADPQGRLPGT